MAKSIENIWKQGFSTKDELVAPQLNDFYNKKSKHMVDKFIRRYSINLKALVVYALILLPVTFIVDLPYLGIAMFVLFNVVVIANLKFRRRLEAIDKNVNSYQYLESFYEWITGMVDFNAKMSRFLYPYIFLSTVAGFWFGDIGGSVPGNEWMAEIKAENPHLVLIFDFPLIGWFLLILTLALLAFFGDRIGRWDVNLIYGRIIKKLNQLLGELKYM